MFKTYLVILLLISAVDAFAQAPKEAKASRAKVRDITEVGEVRRDGYVIARLSYQLHKGETWYIVNYEMGASTERLIPTSFVFIETGGICESFYNTLITAVKAEKGTKSSIQLDKRTIRLETKEKRGFKHVHIDVKRGGMFDLSEEEIQKLFGKS